jgi:xylan 1,4-beta-xylosidase
VELAVSGDGAPARVVATRAADGSVRVMAVNFEEPFDYADELAVALNLDGLADGHWRVRHYRIDRDHSNAHTVWLGLGRPIPPDDDQLAAIQARMGLETFEPDFTPSASEGSIELRTTLPPRAVSLWVLTPA